MPRPSLTHDGFLIPNASDVTNPRMAEPDRIDFNTLAHARWGVIEGCLVTVSGASAQCALGGLAIVNGVLVTVSSGQAVNVGVGGSQDRFDLIAVDGGGTLVHVQGTPSADPVFPDPPTNVTVLAAVFAPTGTSNLSENVIDKRKFVSRALLTKIPTYDPLVQNRNGTGNEFLIQGDGKMTWHGDVVLERAAPKYLRVLDNIIVNGVVQTNEVVATNNIQSLNGKINGRNFRQDATTPPAVMGPFDHLADLWQDSTNGKLFLRKKGPTAGSDPVWEEIVTTSGAVPVGAVMNSVEPPEVMGPLGWVPLQGQTVTYTQYPRLFSLVSMQRFISGTGDNRTMKLPNATSRVFTTRWNVVPLTEGGLATNTTSLLLANMPKHKHNVTNDPVGATSLSAITISRNGSHIHGMAKGGRHIHSVRLYDHVHNGMDNYGSPAPVIAVAWGGRNKIDALFNDRNHTYSVEAAHWTMPAQARVDVLEGGSEHGHTLEEDGDHTHTAQGSIPGHNHGTNEDYQGSGSAFDVTNAYLSIYSYIRS